MKLYKQKLINRPPLEDTVRFPLYRFEKVANWTFTYQLVYYTQVGKLGWL